MNRVIRAWPIFILLAVPLLMTGCGSGSSSTSRSTSALCAPSGCAGVEGVVEACGGIAPGHCHLERIAWVALLDSHGRPVSKQLPAAGHLIDGHFSLPSQVPGHYLVETRVDGVLRKRSVTVVGNAMARVNVVIAIK
jgi:hypothetical protein